MNALSIAMVVMAMQHVLTLKEVILVLATEHSQEMGKIVQVSECNLRREVTKTKRSNVC